MRNGNSPAHQRCNTRQRREGETVAELQCSDRGIGDTAKLATCRTLRRAGHSMQSRDGWEGCITRPTAVMHSARPGRCTPGGSAQATAPCHAPHGLIASVDLVHGHLELLLQVRKVRVVLGRVEQLHQGERKVSLLVVSHARALVGQTVGSASRVARRSRGTCGRCSRRTRTPSRASPRTGIRHAAPSLPRRPPVPPTTRSRSAP